MKAFRRLLVALSLMPLFLGSISSFNAHPSSIDQEVIVKPASRTAKEVKVGFFSFAGYHEYDETTGHRSGYGYDFLQMMARYNNFSYTYVGYDQNWSDMKADLNLEPTDDNYIDMVTSASAISGYTLSDNNIGYKSAMLTVKADNDDFSDGNYDGMNIGLLKSSTGTNAKLTTFMSNQGYSYNSFEYDDVDDLCAYLQAGQDEQGNKIDAILTSNLRKPSNEWILEQIDPDPFFVLFKEGNTELKDEVDYAIDQMDSADPSWRSSLMNKYYSSETDPFTSEETVYLNSLKGTTLKAAIDPDYFPYCYFEDKKAKGIIPSIFDILAKQMGIDYEIVYCETREDYKNLIYPSQGIHAVDLVLDGVDDYSIAENNQYKNSNSYLSAEISELKLRSFSGEIGKVAVPKYAVESSDLATLYGSKIVGKYDTIKECVDLVKNGKVDAAYLPNAMSRYYSLADAKNSLGYSIIPGHSRSYVISVSANYTYVLTKCFNRAIANLSEKDVNAVVAEADNLPIDTGFIGFLYDYPLAFGIFVGFVLLAIFVIAFWLIIVRNRWKEREMQNETSRFVSYICSSDDTVAEVDLQDMKIRRYGFDEKKKMMVKEYPLDKLEQYNEPREQVVFHHDYDVLSKEVSLDELKKIISDGNPVYYEARCDSKGEPRWYSYWIQPVEKGKGHPMNFIVYRRDVDEAKKEADKKEQALADALTAAQTSSEAKGSFLSKMSHEIRTPLNAIIGYIDMARDAKGDSKKISRYVDSSELAARHLLSVINDVLDMSSIESGHLKLANDPFDIKALLSTISSIYLPQAKAKGINFELVVKSLNYERFIGDSLRVNQVLMNLLSNSLKFTNPGGRVSLTVKEKDGEGDTSNLTFEIKDTGCGMSPEFLKKAFTPFEQESASTARLYGGSGLGLSISQNLVNLMGGTIGVTSEVGKGSLFTVILPFKADRSTANNGIKHKAFSLLRALVVDDEENEREYATTILKRLSIRSDAVGDGPSALKKILIRDESGHPYDFCLMDWKMPGEDGLEASKKIREKVSSKLPIIMLTAYDVDSIKDQAASFGVDKVISKPLFKSSLFDLLVTMYGSYEKDGKQETPEDETSFEGVHVLLAEDNDMNLEIAEAMLKKKGIIVTVARDGKQVVDLYVSSKPNTYQAILMDIQMPGLDGYQATKEIRKSSHPQAKIVPIVAMTADAFSSDVSLALASGMNDHVAKPIDKKRLFNVLSEQIKRFQKEGEGI